MLPQKDTQVLKQVHGLPKVPSYVYGLPNLSATCWLNSVLQSLLSCSPFVEWLLSDSWASLYQKKNHLLEILRNLTIFLLKDGYFDSKKVVLCLHLILNECRTVLPIGQQHDANDCLFTLLDLLHKNVAKSTLHMKDFLSHPDKKPQYDWHSFHNWSISPLHDLMYGSIACTMRHSITGEESLRFEPFSILYVSPPKKEDILVFNLEDCLQLFAKEGLVEESPWLKKTCLYTLPDVLMISCFHPPEPLEAGRFFVPSLTLTLNPSVVGYQGHFDGPKKTYELVACLYHLGNDQGGHYMTVCKRGGRWYRLDDANVHEIPEEIIRKPMNYLPKLFFYCVIHE
jgi:ubiquitin C-terminal hydrolase